MIVHLVTDRLRLTNARSSREERRRCLLAQLRYAVKVAVDVIQIRERDLEGRELAALVRDVLALAHGTRTLVVVNDRLDVALCCGANGVHLRGDSISPADVRTIAPRPFLVGRSIHRAEDVEDVQQDLDYVIVGPVWPTKSKPRDHPTLGIEGLQRITSRVPVPALAIGGVTPANAHAVARAGAIGVAGIGLFIDDSADRDCRAYPLDAVTASLRTAFEA